MVIGRLFGLVLVVPLLLVGGTFVVAGLVTAARARRNGRLRARAIPVAARVTASDTLVGRDRDGDIERTVLTTLEFEDRLEQTHSVQVELPVMVPPLPGDTVDVVYDPQYPKLVLPAGRGAGTASVLVAGFFAVVGAGLLLIAAVGMAVLVGIVDLPVVLGLSDVRP